MELVCGEYPLVELNEAEIRRRLQIPQGICVEGMDRCLEQLTAVAVLRYAYVRVPVEVSAEKAQFDLVQIDSVALAKALSDCEEAYLLAVTLGMGVDRLLTRLKLLSAAEHFIADGLASAMAEALCDRVNRQLAEAADLKPRFSPGYGDVPLWVQKPLLLRLQADKTLGITLNDACLMTPSKSITAIIGIKGVQIGMEK